MLVNVLRTLFGYNRWVTERLLDAASHLSPEQFHAPGNAGRGSVRDTLVHLLSAQRGWLAWWDGVSRLDPADFPDLDSVRALWEEVEAKTDAFTARLTEEEAERIFSGTAPSGSAFSMPLWRMMLHVANHCTQHRSEVAAMLTAFGRSPGNLDLVFYQAE